MNNPSVQDVITLVRQLERRVKDFPRSNWTANADPTVNDDADKGYRVGSWWYRPDLNKLWICQVATMAAAVWLAQAGGTELPADALGFLHNDGNGGVSWQQVIASVDTAANYTWTGIHVWDRTGAGAGVGGTFRNLNGADGDTIRFDFVCKVSGVAQTIGGIECGSFLTQAGDGNPGSAVYQIGCGLESGTSGVFVVKNSVVLGALGGSTLPTNATEGFVYVPTIAGQPTGVPTIFPGTKPLVLDVTNVCLWARIGNQWRNLTGNGVDTAANYIWTGIHGFRSGRGNEQVILENVTPADVDGDQGSPVLAWQGRAWINNADTPVKMWAGLEAGGQISILRFQSESSLCLDLWSNGSVVVGPVGVLPTDAQGGFLMLPTMAGSPAGIPAISSSKLPVVFDTTAKKLHGYVYPTGWVGIGGADVTANYTWTGQHIFRRTTSGYVGFENVTTGSSGSLQLKFSLGDATAAGGLADAAYLNVVKSGGWTGMSTRHAAFTINLSDAGVPALRLQLFRDGTLQLRQPAIASMPLNSQSALHLLTDASASNGVQQISPGVVWEGAGWKTDVPSASQRVLFRACVVPVQGADAPAGYWGLSRSIDVGAAVEVLRVDATGSVVLGAQSPLATNATDGFVYFPSCAGTPNGTPTAFSGKGPIVLDTAARKIWAYLGGAWRDLSQGGIIDTAANYTWTGVHTWARNTSESGLTRFAAGDIAITLRPSNNAYYNNENDYSEPNSPWLKLVAKTTNRSNASIDKWWGVQVWPWGESQSYMVWENDDGGQYSFGAEGNLEVRGTSTRVVLAALDGTSSRSMAGDGDEFYKAGSQTGVLKALWLDYSASPLSYQSEYRIHGFWKQGGGPVESTWLRYTGKGSLILGNALAADATEGFLYLRACLGTPTGTPRQFSEYWSAGSIPILIDSTNSKLCAYIGGVWKTVTLI